MAMSDNRATELQGILDEFEHECFMLRVEASETRAKGDVVRKSYERIRDEYAGRITATLGSEQEKLVSDLWQGHECGAGCAMYEECRHPIGDRCPMEERVAELGGGTYEMVTSGTLTAEQVRKVLLYHLPHREYHSVEQTDAWQAIADELNAKLGSGTCEYVIEDNMNESEGMGDVWFRCTNCCTCYDYYADDWLLKMPHCPKCGAIVEGVR